MKIKNPFVRAAALLAAAGTVASMVTGCGVAKLTEQYQDAPRAGQEDMTGAQIIAMPDGWGNIATKCVGDIRYSTLFHNNDPYGALATVVDPECKK